jgi:hypothetical protein
MVLEGGKRAKLSVLRYSPDMIWDEVVAASSLVVAEMVMALLRTREAGLSQAM